MINMQLESPTPTADFNIFQMTCGKQGRGRKRKTARKLFPSPNKRTLTKRETIEQPEMDGVQTGTRQSRWPTEKQ